MLQVEGLSWLVHMYKNHMPAILGDQMGLGKTFQVTPSLLCFGGCSSQSSQQQPHKLTFLLVRHMMLVVRRSRSWPT